MIAIGVGGADAVDAMTGTPWELKAPHIVGKSYYSTAILLTEVEKESNSRGNLMVGQPQRILFCMSPESSLFGYVPFKCTSVYLSGIYVGRYWPNFGIFRTRGLQSILHGSARCCVFTN